MVGGGDTGKMIAVGLVWGATNAVMRRGTILWDQALQSSRRNDPNLRPFDRLKVTIIDWIKLLLIWQYSVPFLINLSASATFFAILSHTPISLAVPVTNATTFAATAVVGVLLGEETHLGFAFSGIEVIGCLDVEKVLKNVKDFVSVSMLPNKKALFDLTADHAKHKYARLVMISHHV
ncbi:uncharacterized protein LOC107431914 [Ziziphus jujuba]|uniref:Uncharacterized protein LOC107431914 n=2 Tax=Ziziphus jujuba TaxID=326968 RepID=A0A6P4APV8_ZIZJJ|nr:uncharacterized protein LOC107431914 [Ziziphus jujuba]KAH7511953.1 hypothetical protein FEM48_Zijuj12G0038600 [Ziziphus jujuba var. spinosa]